MTLLFSRTSNLALLLVVSSSVRRGAVPYARAFTSTSVCGTKHRVPFVTASSSLTTPTKIIDNKHDAVLNMAEEGGEDSFFDDYDEFVSKIDFTDDGWSNNDSSPMDSGRGGGGGGGGYNSRGGGGGGGRARKNDDSFFSGGHDYQRAADDRPGGENTATIDALISERLQFRKTGRYDEADDVRDVLLKDHGVVLWDKDRVWTTNTDRRGGGGGGRSNDRGGRNERGGGRGGGRERKQRDFGPNGHDYEQTGGALDASCSFTEAEIHEFLAERLRCKMSRNFRQADEIQDHLRDNGVHVHDGMKEWRADGVEWERSQRTDDFHGGPARIRAYKQRGPGLGIAAETVVIINEMVAQRSHCKAEKDYDTGDGIRKELSEKYDVSIDDKRLEWAFRDEEYLLAEDSPHVPDAATQAIIGKELGIRVVAKMTRDYDAADAIRDDLRERFGVNINDRNKEYGVEYWQEGEASEGASDWDDGAVEEREEDSSTEDVVEEAVAAVATENVVEEAVAAVEEEDLTKCTVPQLKERLREEGLPVSGKKAELIERLNGFRFPK